MIRKYWLGVLAVIALIIIIAFAVIRPDETFGGSKFVETVTIILGYILFFLQYFYSKSEGFYLKANNLRLWLTNDTTKWNFTIDFYDCAQVQPLKNIWSVASRKNNNAIKWHDDEHSIIINMPGYTIRSFISNEEYNESRELDYRSVVTVQVSNLELPYKSFKQKIENEIIPLLKDIVDVIKPEKEKYAAKISFSSSNPYFGYFVRKLELTKVVSFSCDLIETSVGGHPQTITVRKDRIDIVTNDLLSLQTLSMKYAALSGG